MSVAVVHHRAERRSSQAAFATVLGWKQAHITRLEPVDITTPWRSLQRLARAGSTEVYIERDGTRVLEAAGEA